MEPGAARRLGVLEYPMATHKFQVGQVVDFAPSRQSMPASAREYKIIRLMPAEGADNLYRIKCSVEPYERIARERELTRR